MILVCGVPTETSVALVVEALTSAGLDHVMLNQRVVRELGVEIGLGDSGITGRLTGGIEVDLSEVTAVYLRFMDDRWLPELEHEPVGSPARVAGRAFHEIVGQWADVTPALVVNRYQAMGSNFSKPYQLQLIREQGFAVPATLVTDDPAEVLRFRDVHREVIYKSISSERSIVNRLAASDLSRLERIRACPVQFQEYIPGPNVRVHTVGERVFATRVETDAVDYRYSFRQVGEAATFVAIELNDDLAERCIRLSRALGLVLAGVDLKLALDGRIVCLEVNPSPVFSYYERQTGQPIAAAIAALLGRASP